MKFTKIVAGASASVALLGAGAFTSVVPQASVQAASKYQVRVSKKTYVYNSKGKKTKKSYKKNAKLTVYGTKTIKGKKYYNLGKGRFIRTSNAKKVFVRYSYSTQTKKITRTIKLYQPTGEKKVIQNAYIKRSVKTDTKTKKKTYGKWNTSSWKKYTVAKVEGYTASRSSVGAAKVTSKTKNKTIKVTYKKNASVANSGSNSNSSSTSKPTNSGSNTSKKSFTVKAINEVTTSRGKEYEYTMYSKKGSTFTNEGKTTVMDGNQTFTVSDESTDSQGNTYYYVTDSDGDKYWVVSTDTDKPNTSHVVKNTLSVTPANFNVKRNISSGDGSKNIDMFTLNSDKTLSRKKNDATTEYFEGAYYPVVYHVSATATDKNGVKWYNISDPLDNNSSVWVKTDGFTQTNQAAGSTHPTLMWNDEWENKLQDGLLSLINELRAEANNGANPLTIANDKQQQIKGLAKEYALKSIKKELIGQGKGHIPSGASPSLGDGEAVIYARALGDENSVSTKKMYNSSLDGFRYDLVREKNEYEQAEGVGQNHYVSAINPKYKKMVIGSTTEKYNGSIYVVTFIEYYR